MIYIVVVREAYELEEISNVGHVRTDQNPADALAKVESCSALKSVLGMGCLDLTINQCIICATKHHYSHPKLSRQRSGECESNDLHSESCHLTDAAVKN